MTTIYSTPTVFRGWTWTGRSRGAAAAAVFFTRYSGRTLDAYRDDLRGFFHWSTDVGRTVLAANVTQTRGLPGWMADRAGGLDDRPATIDGVRLLVRHIDGRSPSNLAEYVC